MKYLLLAFTITFSTVTIAQPVVDGSNTPAPGFSGTLSIATTFDPGASGPNQTWDFSSLTFTTLGAITVTDPSLTPMAASFPSANFCFSLIGTYSFFKIAADKMEVQAYTITAAGDDGDYSPNHRTMMTFPFNYLDEFTDTWQKVGESENTVNTTYDAYGTLITPDATYENVVRIAENYGGGEIDYQWFSLDPFMFLMVYSHSENQLYYSGIETAPVEIAQITEDKFQVFPNPAGETICFKQLNEQTEEYSTVVLHTLSGQQVLKTTLNSSVTCLDINHLASGSYFYRVTGNNGVTATGIVAIE